MTQTKKNLALMTALALVAGGIGLYAYFGIKEGDEREAKRKERDEKLLAFGAPSNKRDGAGRTVEFTRLVVTAKGETTTLERHEGKWRIISPMHAPADAFALDAITSQLQTGKFKDTIEEKPTAEDLKRYGLDAPRFTLVATVRDVDSGEVKELKLKGGVENTFDGSVYVQRDDDPRVFSVQGGVRWTFEKTSFDLRDKKVLALPEKDATRVEVTTPRGSWVAEKTAETPTAAAPLLFVDAGTPAPSGSGPRWKLTWRPASGDARGGETFDADAQAITHLLAGLANYAALSFRVDSSEERTRTGTDKPFTAAVISLKNEDPIRLSFGRVESDAGEQVFVLRTQGHETTLAEVSGAAAAALDKDPIELRDRAVLSFDKDAVARIAFIKPGSPRIVVERKRGADGVDAWTVVEPRSGPAKKWKLSSILWTLGSLKAKELGEASPKSWGKWGLDKPEREVQLIGSDGRAIATLAVGKDVEGMTDTKYVRGTRDQVVQMDTSRLTDLPESVADVLDGSASTVAADAGGE